MKRLNYKEREDLRGRAQFNKTIRDLTDILKGYDRAFHWAVINNYLETYNLFTQDTARDHSIRGRIYFTLGALNA